MASLVIGLAGEEDLGSKVDIRESSLSGDFNSITQSTGGSERPTGSTIMWDVLVSQNSQVIDTTVVSPEEVLRESADWELFEWGLDNTDLWESGVSVSTSVKFCLLEAGSTY